ncbi:MAG: hypothetical protein K6D94_02765 [Clostridiales bacterium]|nr:hypothetical protein [Clostridiales bacterium]
MISNGIKTRNIAALLSAIIIICGFIGSCADSGKPESEETTAGVAAESDIYADTADEKESDGYLEDSSVPKTEDILPGLDFGGTEIRFMLEAAEPKSIEGYDQGDIVDSKIYERNLNVSEALNVNIKCAMTVEYMTMAPTLRNIISAGDDAIDVAAVLRWCSASVAPLGYLQDVSEMKYINLDNPWWAKDYIDAMAYNGVYLLTSDMMTSYIGGAYAIFANARLWEGLDLPNIYDIVRDGRWTLDLMTEYTEKAWQDINNNGITDEGDVVGFSYGFTEELVNGLGVEYCKRDENNVPYIALNNEHTVAVWDKLYKLYIETPGSYLNPGYNSISDFVTGSALMVDYDISSSSSPLRAMEDDYYIIPTPKFNEAQNSYITLNVGQPAQYGVPITAVNTDAISAALEAMAAESRRILRPAYYNVHLGEKVVRDADSKEMIDLIMDNIHVDFGYCYAGAIGSGLGQDNWFMFFDIFRTIGQQKNNNFVSTFEQKGPGYEKRLQSLLKAFDKLKG